MVAKVALLNILRESSHCMVQTSPVSCKLVIPPIGTCILGGNLEMTSAENAPLANTAQLDLQFWTNLFYSSHFHM